MSGGLGLHFKGRNEFSLKFDPYTISQINFSMMAGLITTTAWQEIERKWMWMNESYLEVVRITINRFLWSSSFVTKLSNHVAAIRYWGYTWPDNSWGRFWRMYTLKCWSIIFRDRVQHFFLFSFRKRHWAALVKICGVHTPLLCKHLIIFDWMNVRRCSESARCAVSVFFYYSSNGYDHGKKNFEVK